MSSTQVFGNCLSMQCELKSHVHMIQSLIGSSSVFCFSGTFATFRGGNECYWLREQLFFIMWLNICSNHEVRIINFLMVFFVLPMTLNLGLHMTKLHELIIFPMPLLGTWQYYHKSFEHEHYMPKFKCRIRDTLSLIYCKFQPCIWQYMFKIQVLLSLLTVLSPQWLD